ncbi:SEC13 protein, partial [Polypterus senegalus]
MIYELLLPDVELHKFRISIFAHKFQLSSYESVWVSVINTVDTSHEDMIHDAQMDYYGTRLATCSSDRSVKIFDVKNGGQILVADLRGHEGPVWQVAWAHPMYGNILSSCSYDRKVIIWKEENGTWDKMYEYTGHDSSVNSVCWGPYEFGLILACGSSDGAISLLTFTGDGQWEIKKIANAHTIGCNAVSWAPAVVPSSLIDQPSGQKPNYIKRFVSGGCDNLVKLWKEEDGQWKEDQKLEAHSDWVTLWKESVDGQWACISDVNKGQGAVSSITEGNAYMEILTCVGNSKSLCVEAFPAMEQLPQPGLGSYGVKIGLTMNLMKCLW